MGEPLVPGQEPLLAPGVRGYSVMVDGILHIPLVTAERDGSGDVGRFLDSIPKDQPVRFPTVMSARLAGMLMRRGFEFREMVDDGDLVHFWGRP
jgi:hypothetical protein